MELTVSNKTIVRIVVIAAASVLALRALTLVYTPLIWIFTAFFLALALEPAVNRLSRYMPGRSRGLAVFLVLALTFAVLAFVVVALVPPFVSQLYHLVRSLPDTYQQFVSDNPQLSGFLNAGLSTENAKEAVRQFSSQLLSFGGSAVVVLKGIFGGILALLTVLILTFFMVLEGPHWIDVAWTFLPSRARHEYRDLLQQLHGTITGFVNGNILKSLIAVAASGIMLLLLRSPYSLALALLVGILDLIPMVGATIGAVTVCVVVLMFKGVVPALVMAGFFIIFQQVENYVIQPWIFSKTVEVSPLVTMLALILGASMAGFIGALVAIPVAASAQIVVKYWQRERALKAKAAG